MSDNANKYAAACLIIICLLLICLNINSSRPLDKKESFGGTRADFPGINIYTDIVSDDTWSVIIDPGWGYQLPYIVNNNVTVRAGATLVIDPDNVILFAPHTYLAVEGALRANGEYYEPIYFLPFKLPGEEYAPMDWIGLMFLAGSQNSLLERCVIRYAETGVNCTAITSPTISNCTIEYSYYSAVYCGEYTQPVIRNNLLNITEWSTIVCTNTSHPVIEGNTIETAQYGIVTYSGAEINANHIKKCWLGIFCLGNANITGNDFSYYCTDGIHAFYSDPRIEGNYIDGCGGNGTRFVYSNATFRNNTLRSNDVGIDISYDARGVITNMSGNMVNGFDIQKCYILAQSDLALENILVGNSWPYNGELTAQGGITLYDCKNVTMRDCVIRDAYFGVFTTNSSVDIYNTTIEDYDICQALMNFDSSIDAYNHSVDAESVAILNTNNLFISFDELQILVYNYTLAPIEDATAVVRESFMVLHNTTTDQAGSTGQLVVKNKTVSEGGIIASPLTIQIYAEEYNFADNPRTIYVSSNKSVSFVDLGDIVPPTVLSASIADGDRTVQVNQSIIIEFSEPMDRSAAEAAFSISGNVTGTFSWSGNNMTFTPSQSLGYVAYYTVSVNTAASDLNGNTLPNVFSFSFTTIPEPSAFSWPMMAGAAVIIIAVVAISSWLLLRKPK
jgi:hypothetical protein